MGYTTDFLGEVTISPPLNAKEVEFINKFGESRRMNRKQGPYFIGADGEDYGGPGVINHNEPPPCQPGLWCNWEADEGGGEIRWNGAEKFYKSHEWMIYIIHHFLMPGAFAKSADPKMKFLQANHVVNGTINAQGEDDDDSWRLVVRDNIVSTERGVIVYADAGSPDLAQVAMF
jgi:hypothetical protein